METQASVDLINRSTMRASVHEYPAHQGLSESERVVFSSVSREMKNKRILDIGVGGGRTVIALRKISTDYVGVDYVQEMVDQCRSLFPEARFERADARAMPEFEDRSFDLIVFACNGISMVDHEGRLGILKEVRRLLRRGGIFIFSTYNRKSARHDSVFSLPPYQATSNPLKILVRRARFVLQIFYQIFNRLRYKRHEVRNEQYSIINDKCHLYQTMLYYITLENQRKQLEAAGFGSHFTVYDTSGKIVKNDTADDSMTFVVRA